MNPTDKIKKQAEKEAIQYAEIKFSRYYENTVLKKDIEDSKKDFENGFIAGIEYISQWNSPDEKPEVEKLNDDNEVLLLIHYKDASRYFYDIGSYIEEQNKFHAYNWDAEYIIKWQYLPLI